jgi:hypothetical protein
MTTIVGIAVFIGYIGAIVLLSRHFGAKPTNVVRTNAEPQSSRKDLVVWYYASAKEAQTRRKRIIAKFELDPEKVVVKRRWVKARDGKVFDAYAVVITDPAYGWS